MGITKECSNMNAKLQKEKYDQKKVKNIIKKMATEDAGIIADAMAQCKQMEDELEQKMLELETFVNNIPHMAWLKDTDSNFILANKAFGNAVGMDPEYLKRNTCAVCFGEEADKKFKEDDRKVIEGKKQINLEESIVDKDGKTKYLETTKSPIFNDTGDVVGTVGVAIDITDRKQAEDELSKYRHRLEVLVEKRTEELKKELHERKRAEDALQESGQKLRNVFESVSEGIFTMDLNGVYTEVNNRVLDMYNMNSSDEILGKSGFQFVAPHDIEKAKDSMKIVLEQGTIVCQEFASLRTDGSEFDVEITGTLLKDESGNPIGIIGVARDITQRKRVEEELRKSERLESLGFLAGGIAHDFNNLLFAILGNIQFAMLHSSSEEKVLNSLNRAVNAMDRAKDLTNQLLTFASGGAPVMKIISIRDVIKEAASLAFSGANIHPAFSIDLNIWPVEADQGQIYQVMSNILLNARQAMPEGGTIELEAANVNLKPEQILTLQKGMYVKITIKDHGVGMPGDILEKIFDPFFTTKQEGSGLGLSICYSIVKKHNGHITVDSRPGIGSVFTLYLPASEKEIPSVPEKQFEIKKGEGKILVMDDEIIIREVLASSLDDLGYEVEITQDGDEAIKAYKEATQSGKKFDAVILDLTVQGGKGGKETIAELLKIDSDVKAVVSSGYSEDPVMASPQEYGFQAAIVKPYKMEDLSQALYAMTDKNNDKDQGSKKKRT
jgi:PAS domain S-box-containing protein